jgi:hypothetical protein
LISFKVFLLEEISEIRVNGEEWDPNKAKDIFEAGETEHGVTTHTIQYMHKGKQNSLHISFSKSDDQQNTHVLTLYGQFGVMTPTRHGGVIPIARILAHAISNHLVNHPKSNVSFFDFNSKPGRDLYATLIRRLKGLGEQLGLKHELVQYDPKETPTHIITKP